MPTIDYSRSALVTQENRWRVREDTSISANNKQARQLDLPTQVTAASEEALSLAIFNELKKEAQGYRVVVEGLITQDDLAGTVPHYTLDAPIYSTDGRTMKSCALEIDWLTGRTEVVIRG